MAERTAQECLKAYLDDCDPEQVLDIALRLIDRTSEAIIIDEFPEELNFSDFEKGDA